MKSVQIRSFFWSAFSRIRTEYGPEKTPYLDTFHTVHINILSPFILELSFSGGMERDELHEIDLH